MSPRFVDKDGDGITDETGPGFIDVDGDGENEVDEGLDAASLQHAIAEWSDSGNVPLEELLFYYVGHGGQNGVYLNQSDSLLPIGDIDGWLDDLQHKGPIRVISIFESCYSGAFLPKMTPPAGKERIVVTSVAADQDASASGGGRETFSGFFWRGVRYDGELYKSYSLGVEGVPSAEATPRIDIDGDGAHDVPSENLPRVFIGLGKSSASELPVVDGAEVVASPTCGTSATIRATGVTAANAISSVYARILGPLNAITATGKPRRLIPSAELDLLPGSGDREYEGVFDGFDESGEYEVTIYAVDFADVLSLPALTKVNQTCLPGGPLGDVNDDGKADLADALIGLRVLAGHPDPAVRPDFSAAGVDVGGDGRVGMADVVFILRKVAGK